MNAQTEIYITVLKGKKRLVITGELSLLKEFIGFFPPIPATATIYNPAEPFLTETFTIEKGDQHHDRNPE